VYVPPPGEDGHRLARIRGRSWGRDCHAVAAGDRAAEIDRRGRQSVLDLLRADAPMRVSPVRLTGPVHRDAPLTGTYGRSAAFQMFLDTRNSGAVSGGERGVAVGPAP